MNPSPMSPGPETMTAKDPGRIRIRYNFKILLVVLLLMILISPLLNRSLLGEAIGETIAFLIAVAALFVIRKSRIFHVALVLFLANTAGSISLFVVPHKTVLVANTFVSAALLALITCKVIHVVLNQETIRADTIMGGLCGYLLLASVWTMLYLNLEVLRPGSFNFQAHGTDLDFMWTYSLLSYYSMTTILTIGPGDIIPMSRWAQTLTIMEGLIGQFYIIFFISSLVGMYISDRNSRGTTG